MKVSPVVLFVHIPKTAGTTFTEIAHRQYPVGTATWFHDEAPSPRFDALNEREKAGLRFIGGHMFFGLHEVLPRPCTYISFIRSPAARHVSLYHYLRREPPVTDRRKAAREMTLPEYSNSEWPIWNDAVRRISGVGHKMETCTEDTLQQAKANLVRWFSVLGITERFDQSLVLMRKRLGWGFPFYRPLNVSSSRPSRQELSDEVTNIVTERDALDIQLYRFGCELFEDAVAHIPGFHEDVVRFSMLNQLLRRTFASAIVSQSRLGSFARWGARRVRLIR